MQHNVEQPTGFCRASFFTSFYYLGEVTFGLKMVLFFRSELCPRDSHPLPSLLQIIKAFSWLPKATQRI